MYMSVYFYMHAWTLRAFSAHPCVKLAKFMLLEKLCFEAPIFLVMALEFVAIDLAPAVLIKVLAEMNVGSLKCLHVHWNILALELGKFHYAEEVFAGIGVQYVECMLRRRRLAIHRNFRQSLLMTQFGLPLQEKSANIILTAKVCAPSRRV